MTNTEVEVGPLILAINSILQDYWFILEHNMKRTFNTKPFSVDHMQCIALNMSISYH